MITSYTRIARRAALDLHRPIHRIGTPVFTTSIAPIRQIYSIHGSHPRSFITTARSELESASATTNDWRNSAASDECAPRPAVTTTPKQSPRDESYDKALKRFCSILSQKDFWFHHHYLDDVRAMFRPHPRAWPSTHFRPYTEICMTLKGLKPCVLFLASRPEAPPMYEPLVVEVVEPLFEEYGLAEYGFVLQRVEHAQPMGSSRSFNGCWVLADTRSAEWDVVQRAFLDAQRTTDIAVLDASRALGYPMTTPLDFDSGRVVYREDYEEQLFEGLDGHEHFVAAMDYRVGGSRQDYERVLKHFEEWRVAASTVGRFLVLWIDQHPAFCTYRDEDNAEKAWMEKESS